MEADRERRSAGFLRALFLIKQSAYGRYQFPYPLFISLLPGALHFRHHTHALDKLSESNPREHIPRAFPLLIGGQQVPASFQAGVVNRHPLLRGDIEEPVQGGELRQKLFLYFSPAQKKAVLHPQKAGKQLAAHLERRNLPCIHH